MEQFRLNDVVRVATGVDLVYSGYGSVLYTRAGVSSQLCHSDFTYDSHFCSNHNLLSMPDDDGFGPPPDIMPWSILWGIPDEEGPPGFTYIFPNSQSWAQPNAKIWEEAVRQSWAPSAPHMGLGLQGNVAHHGCPTIRGKYLFFVPFQQRGARVLCSFLCLLTFLGSGPRYSILLQALPIHHLH